MPRLDVKNIISRQQKAQARKDEWRSIYEDCYEFALPQRNLYNGYYEGKVAGQAKMNRVFDSTAKDSTQRFANRLQAGLFPPYKMWCRLEPGSTIVGDQRLEAQRILDRYNIILFEVIRQTNFDLAMGEFLLDLAVGTAVMMITQGDEVTPVRFTAIPQYLVAFEEGAYGKVENVYRRLRLRAEAIQVEFPNATISVELESIIDRNPEKEIDLFDAVIYDYEQGIYHYHVIWPEKQQEIVYRTLRSSPFVISRYMKTAGEIYGRGPLVTAIDDIKTLNKVKETILKNASLAVAGVYMAADDGVLNPQNIKIQPGAVISVARNGGPNGASLAPLPRAGDIQTGQIQIEDLRIGIKKMLMDDTLPPDNMSARSATEIAERTRELATNLGSAFGRLITETLVPIVSRTLFVLDQAGFIEMPLKINGRQIKVTPVSPLAQAPKLQEVNNIVQYMQIANSMGPQGQATISVPKVLEFIAERLGIDQNVLNTEEEQQMIMEQMMAAQMAETQPEAVDDAGAVAEALQ